MFGRKPKPHAEPQLATRASIYTTDGEHVRTSAAMDKLAILSAAFQTPAGASGAAMDSSTGLVPEFKQNLAGAGVPDAQFFWYASQGVVSWQVSALISQHWLVDKACSQQ